MSKIVAQAPAWQQQAIYTMDVDVDAEKHQYTGKQTIVYTNNSPDELDKLFYHLYFNAFQPGSMMDVRSRTIKDPDARVGDRISKLSPDEIGYIKVKSLKRNGRALKYKEIGTVLEVELAKPIMPAETVSLEMEWDAQVPLQIRRSGRDNKEGVEFSMSQWYPKLCQYDYRGWHSNPYVGREFYGIWGDFDVTIHMDKDYVIGGTGYLQNPEEIGHGYAAGEGKPIKGKLSWHFKAPKVHDFVWAADPDFIHDLRECKSGLTLHFLYQDDAEIVENWQTFQADVEKIFDIASRDYGQYPYKQYSVIQGGDGGMEYPMATLITGKRKYGSLVGVTAHEVMHSWYQMVLATNEALFGWMDEGFTSYASEEIMAEIFDEDVAKAHAGALRGYNFIAHSEDEEPLCTHSDHFHTNQAYGIAVYSKGEIFVDQLGYVIGEDELERSLKSYFDKWQFKHPEPFDFLRVAEQESGLELDWYLEYWMNSIKTIDYGIGAVTGKGRSTTIQLERIGQMPMPIDLVVTTRDGEKKHFYIPLRIMRGEKNEVPRGGVALQEDWPWTHPTYTLEVEIPASDIESIEIDPSQRMADIERENNIVRFTEGVDFIWRKSE